MENNNSNPDTLKPPRTRTMSESALAANRANAKKSTGPRTAAGKARSASNNFRHGLYRLEYYNHFTPSDDLALATAHNFLEQLAPVTPTEHAYVHMIITLQLRHLALEYLYAKALDDLTAGNEPKHLPLLLRELDRIPYRLEKTLKAYHAEVARRESCPDPPEPIEDFPALPNPTFDKSGTNPNPSQAKAKPQPNPTSAYINEFLHQLSLNYRNGQENKTPPPPQPQPQPEKIDSNPNPQPPQVTTPCES